MDDREIVGSSKAINKTITEIRNFLADQSVRPGGRGADLREFLHERLADLGL
jgi:hypothetical protein